jgi:hypothetical protein
MSEIIGGLTKYVGLWFTAGFIASALTLSVIFLTGGLVGLTSELVTNAVIESLPLPLNLLIGWYIDPLSFVAESVFQVLVFAGLLYLTKG